MTTYPLTMPIPDRLHAEIEAGRQTGDIERQERAREALAELDFETRAS